MTKPSWAERICELCQARAVGPTGPDPHLCDVCAEAGHRVEPEHFDVREYRQSLIDQAWTRRRDR